MNPFGSIGTVHELHHGEFIFLVIVLLVLLYRPPAALQKLSSVRTFIEAHFGDSIGLYILHVGIALVIVGGIWPDMSRVGELGNSLVIAAMGVLKLSKAPPTNGTTDTLTATHTGPVPRPPEDLPTSAMPPAGWGPAPKP